MASDTSPDTPPAEARPKKKLAALLGFVVPSFGPLIVFYSADYLSGLRAAIFWSVIWSFGEIIVYRLRRKPITLFFKFSATITIVFGCIDVYLRKSIFFKYEGAVSNFLVGCFFIATLFGEKTILQELAEAQGKLPGEIPPDLKSFFAFLTVLWSVYLWIKAGVYAWLASIYTLEKFLAIRAVIGNVSMVVLLGISILCAKPYMAILRKRRLRSSSPAPVP